MAIAPAKEIDDLKCRIEGEIPADLNGAFYRLGGQWYYPPKFADDIPLHADGFMSVFRIADGNVHYRSRFVETDRLRANRELGRMRFGYYRNRSTDDLDVRGVNASAANTSAFAFGGKLLALKEDSLPYEIDPITLETCGNYGFDQAFASRTFTAHPKIDGRTGELVTLGYQASAPLSKDAFLYIFAPDGALKNEIRIEMPYLDMIHDMAITRDHIILPLAGYAVQESTLEQGGPLWRWNPDGDALIGIVGRHGDGSDLRWFRGPKKCLLHVYNAFDDGHRLILDAPFYPGNPFPFLPSIDGSRWDPAKAHATVNRLIFDLSSDDDRWAEEQLFDTRIGDLGDVDPRYVGYKHRYCYGGHEPKPADDLELLDFPRPPWPMDTSYVRFDTESGEMEMLRLAPHQALGECILIPKSADAPEGCGYLIGVADDYATGHSLLVIADAEKLEDGPLAMAHLPCRAAPSVHGCWVSQGEMQLFQRVD